MKTKIYNTNIDLVNDLNLNSLLVKRQIDNPSPGAVTGGNYNVYTKFGLNLLILLQDIEQKTNSDINQGP